MRLLLYIFIPLICFAQNPSYLDTVVLKTGNIYPCNITELNETNVKIEYGSKAYKSASGIVTLERIILDENGTVFESGKGFLMEVNLIEEYLEKREKLKREQEKKRIVELKRKKEIEKKNKAEQNDLGIQNLKKNEGNRLAFGAFYIPYYSGKVYYYYQNSGYPSNMYIRAYSDIGSLIEGQFSFLLFPKLHLTFNTSYAASYIKNRTEEHVRYDDSQYDEGNIKTNDLNLFMFNIGLKYYFSNLINNKVSAYVLAGAGKQIAFATDKTEKLFIDEDNPPSTMFDDNNEEFIEDLNSPLNLNFGFGVEYLFNESLSLFSNIRLQYSHISASYDSRQISDHRTETHMNEIKKSDIITRIGLGINFYF